MKKADCKIIHNPMFKEERHSYILKELEKNNRVEVKQLVTTLNVSVDTIRRDINELTRQKKLIKVHGGALPVNFYDVVNKSSLL